MLTEGFEQDSAEKFLVKPGQTMAELLAKPK